MSGNGRSCTARREDGWTLVEVLVSLSILSLLALGAWNAAAVSLRLASDIRDRAMEAARLLELDDRLRGLAGRVRTPYWTAEHAMSLDSGECRVAWLDGDPDKGLLMSFREGRLSLGDGESAAVYAGFRRAVFLSALDADGRPYGVSVELETDGGRVLAVTGRFGGTPLRGGASR